MQKSFGSEPSRKDFGSLFGQLIVARIPDVGHISTVVKPLASPGGFDLAGGEIVGIYTCRTRGTLTGKNTFVVTIRVRGAITFQNGTFIRQVVDVDVIGDSKEN